MAGQAPQDAPGRLRRTAYTGRQPRIDAPAQFDPLFRGDRRELCHVLCDQRPQIESLDRDRKLPGFDRHEVEDVLDPFGQDPGRGLRRPRENDRQRRSQCVGDGGERACPASLRRVGRLSRRPDRAK